jgi:hypothetical protein
MHDVMHHVLPHFGKFNFVNREKMDEIIMNNNEEINEYTFKPGCIWRL